MKAREPIVVNPDDDKDKLKTTRPVPGETSLRRKGYIGVVLEVHMVAAAGVVVVIVGAVDMLVGVVGMVGDVAVRVFLVVVFLLVVLGV